MLTMSMVRLVHPPIEFMPLITHVDADYDAYKRGAFLETADRFSKEKPSDIPGPGGTTCSVCTSHIHMTEHNLHAGRITPDPTNLKANKPPAKVSSADRFAGLQRKLEELERIHEEGKKSVSSFLDIFMNA